MKKFGMFLAVLLMISGVASARYIKEPVGVKNQSDWNAEYMMRQLDKDKDSFLSREEYKSMSQTRDVRRTARQDQKNGIYRTQDEEFDLMDADGDGLVSVADLSYLMVHKNRERNAEKKLPYPVTSYVEEDAEGNEKKIVEVKKNRSGYYHPEPRVIDIPKEELDDEELEREL